MRALIAVWACLLMSACASISKASLDQNVGMVPAPAAAIDVRQLEGTPQVVASTNTATEVRSYVRYIPIDPLYPETTRVYDSKSKKMVEENWDLISNADRLSLLPIQSDEVSVEKDDANGNVTYLTGKASIDVGNYVVIMDYMKYKVEPVFDPSTGNFLGNGKIGVGLRIKATLKTTQANVNLSGLIPIGIAAGLGKVSGGLTVDVIGIDSPDVTNLIPLTAQIDQSSIQGALQALASIKTKIFDSKTKITPHLVAINEVAPDSVAKIISTTGGKK